MTPSTSPQISIINYSYIFVHSLLSFFEILVSSVSCQGCRQVFPEGCKRALEYELQSAPFIDKEFHLLFWSNLAIHVGIVKKVLKGSGHYW